MVESYDGASFNRWQLFFDRHKNSLNFLVNFHHFLGNVPWWTVSFREGRWIFSFWWLNLCSSKWDHFLKIIGVKRKNIWNHNLENVEKLDSNCLLDMYIYIHISLYIFMWYYCSWGLRTPKFGVVVCYFNRVALPSIQDDVLCLPVEPKELHTHLHHLFSGLRHAFLGW